MIATYLLLNYPEKDLLNWRNMQALLGKTGKDGLKRQVTSLDPLHVDMAKADFAFDKYLKETDLETIRDVSAGAATFYVWVSSWKYDLLPFLYRMDTTLLQSRGYVTSFLIHYWVPCLFFVISRVNLL